MRISFWIFDLITFTQSYGPFWLRVPICKACVCNSSYTLCWIFMKFWWLSCAYHFRFLIWSFLMELWPFSFEFPSVKLVSETLPTLSFLWNFAGSLHKMWLGLGFLIQPVLTRVKIFFDLEFFFANLVSINLQHLLWDSYFGCFALLKVTKYIYGIAQRMFLFYLNQMKRYL